MRFRPTTKQWLERGAMFGWPFIYMWMVIALDTEHGIPPGFDGFYPVLLAATAVAGAIGCALWHRAGLELSPRNLAVRRLFSTEVIPWSEVYGITVNNHWTGDNHVYVASVGRFTIRAPAPCSSRRRSRDDPGFDEKVEQIGQFWIDNRGPEWVPQPGYHYDIWRADLPLPPSPPPPFSAAT